MTRLLHLLRSMPRPSDGPWFSDGLPSGWRGRVRRLGPFACPEGWRYDPESGTWELEVLGCWGLAHTDDHDQIRFWVGGAASQYPEDYGPTTPPASPPGIPPVEGGESR